MALLLFNWYSLLVGISLAGSSPEPALHPFYVSVTEINHNAGEKTLEISCKIFTDDFELALAKHSGQKVDLFNPPPGQLTNQYMLNYIRKNLVIVANGKPLTLEFVGFERESEAIWSYYEVKGVELPEKLDILNRLLYDNFDKQINLMHITVKGKRQSTRLNYPDNKVHFNF